MRLLALLATTLVAIPAWSQHRAPPTRPIPPPLLFNAGQCHSQLDPGAKRSRCIECVRQGRKFRTQGRGRGFCENAPPPPPPPPAVLDSPPQCNELAHPPKRGRCMECVTHGGRFFTQGPGHGFCKNAPPPPPPPPPPPAAVLDSPPQCNTLAHPRKRARCMECVTHGGRFFTQGPGHGFCKNAPPPPPPPALPAVLVEPGQCDGLVRPPKRARCVECVTHGGQFFTQGAGHGYCKTAPPPPPPEIPVLRSVPECNEHVRHPGKRARCRHCVMKGGSFHRAGPGQCVHAPPPPPPPPPTPEVITSIPECNHRLGPKHMRKACRRCLKQGGRYHMNGACRF